MLIEYEMIEHSGKAYADVQHVEELPCRRSLEVEAAPGACVALPSAYVHKIVEQVVLIPINPAGAWQPPTASASTSKPLGAAGPSMGMPSPRRRDCRLANQ